jgi:hypothetical protein
MLEWVCPNCQRDVPAGRDICPFCNARTEAAAAAPPAATAQRRPAPRTGFGWADVERGFRFGLGLVAALAVAFFTLYLAAYFGGWDDLAERLARFIRFR